MYMLCVNPIQQQSSLQQNFSPTCTILLDQKKNFGLWKTGLSVRLCLFAVLPLEATQHFTLCSTS